MNERYIYSNSEVVTDETGIFEKVEYSDNIDEILIKENLIEQMELEYEKLKKARQKCIENISFKLLIKSIFSLLSIPIILTLMPFIFGIIKLSTLTIVGCICAMTIPTILATFLIYQYNKTRNTKNGIENQMAFLNQQLSLEKEKLKRLNNDKIKKNELIIVSVPKRLNNITELKKLKEQLLLFYNYGYYQNKYKQYFEQGKLRKKLQKHYSEEEIVLIEHYLENEPKVNQLNTHIFRF